MAASLLERIYGKKEQPLSMRPGYNPIQYQNLKDPAAGANWASFTIPAPWRVVSITGGLNTDANVAQRKLFIDYQDKDGTSIFTHSWGGTCPGSSALTFSFGIGMGYAFTNGTSEVAAVGNRDTAPLIDVPMLRNYTINFAGQNINAGDTYSSLVIWYQLL